MGGVTQTRRTLSTSSPGVTLYKSWCCAGLVTGVFVFIGLVCSSVNAQIILPTELIAWAGDGRVAGDAGWGSLAITDAPSTKSEKTSSESDQFQIEPDLVMNGSSIYHSNHDIRVGFVKIVKGSSYLNLSSATIYARELLRNESSRSTFHLTAYYGAMEFDKNYGGHTINDAGGIGIIPWAVVDEVINNDSFFSFATWNGRRLIELPGSVMKRGLWSWVAANNAIIDHTYVDLTFLHRTINSLTVWSNGKLIFSQSGKLIINSGGLIHTGGGSIFNIHSGPAGGSITTGARRPMYIHEYGKGLNINDSVKLTGGMDVVKTGKGSLNFNSTATHEVGAVYIHQGVMDLKSGTLSVSGNITVGDGSGTDRLRLAGNRKNQIVKTGGGRPTVQAWGRWRSDTRNGRRYTARACQAACRKTGRNRLGGRHSQGEEYPVAR